MAQVSSQSELQTALDRLEPVIQIMSGFNISSQISINYAAAIESPTPGAVFTLTKDPSHFTYLFRILDGGSLTLKNITLDGGRRDHPAENDANRSLLYVTGGTLNLLEGSVLCNNNSYLEGGGVYLNSSSAYSNTFHMSNDAQITGCYSRTNGGGIMIAMGNAEDSYTISDTALIAENEAANGGGIYYRSYLADAPGGLTIDGQVQIKNNKACSNGGGIVFLGYRNAGNGPSTLTVTGTHFSQNHASHGAGIYFYASTEGDRLIISGNTSISGNEASQNGGGCFVTAQGAGAGLTMVSASVTGNTGGTGGGLYLMTNTGGDVTISESIINDNNAANGASGTGGGLWAQNQSQDMGLAFRLTKTTLSGNQASAHGGGMAVYGGPGTFSLTAEDCTVENNRAAQSGGGLLISNSGTGEIELRGLSVSKNTASGSGGGVYYANTGNGISTFLMAGSSVLENTAGLEGGGLRLTSGSGILTSTLRDCTVNENTAKDNSGGGIWNGGTNDSLTLEGSTTVDKNNSIAGNGGGIYFNSYSGTMRLLHNAKITNNRADAVLNSTGNHGGGICLMPGSLTVQDEAKIAFNRAGKYGGGISASGESKVFLEGGAVRDNSSGEYGGGLWVHGNSTATVSGGSVSGNRAPFGGGIYNDSTLYAAGNRDINDGVYIENRYASVRLQNALIGNASIQLESSNYVSPNPDGTPIAVGESTMAYPILSQSDADDFSKPETGFDGWEIRLSDDRSQILLTPVIYHIQYKNLSAAANSNPRVYTVNTPDIVLRAPNELSGHRFLGWFTIPAGGNPIASIPQGSIGNMTLYARWEVVPEDHTITFDGNTDSCQRVQNVPSTVSAVAGQVIVLPENIPVKKGCCFQVWNTDCFCLGESYLPGETITVKNDLYLYAVWKKRSSFRPCLPFVRASFTALMLDSGGTTPLKNIAFTLSLNGKVIRRSVSDASGNVLFCGLKPGVYLLKEESLSAGSRRACQVTVNLNGTAEINGSPANGYIL